MTTTDTKNVSPETKFVIGGASPLFIRAFLKGQGIEGAHFYAVEGYWRWESEAAVVLTIAGLTYSEVEEIAVKLCVYFAQEKIYVTYKGNALLIGSGATYKGE